MMQATFWVLAAVLGWCYVGYPITMFLRARFRPVPVHPTSGPLPAVTVVVAVRDEAARIGPRLENLLDLDYPSDRLDIIVVCNGCGDGTDEVVERFANRYDRVRLLRSSSGGGKSAAVNEGVAAAAGEVLVFADARQRFDRTAVRALVEPFGDPSVGAVTGRLVIRASDRPAVRGAGLYWGAETGLRGAESRTGSVVGVTGAIYAIRRELFAPMPAGLILDDVWVPMRIAQAGHRVVMAIDAAAYDDASPGESHEFSRRRRTMVGNIQLMRAAPDLLVPWRNPLWSRYVSHKLLRLASPFCFLGLLLTSALLPGVYRVFFGIEASAYALGLLGLVLPLAWLAVPAAFVMMHGAVLAALPHVGSSAERVWVRPPSTEEPVAAEARAGGSGL